MSNLTLAPLDLSNTLERFLTRPALRADTLSLSRERGQATLEDESRVRKVSEALRATLDCLTSGHSRSARVRFVRREKGSPRRFALLSPRQLSPTPSAPLPLAGRGGEAGS